MWKTDNAIRPVELCVCVLWSQKCDLVRSLLSRAHRKGQAVTEPTAKQVVAFMLCVDKLRIEIEKLTALYEAARTAHDEAQYVINQQVGDIKRLQHRCRELEGMLGERMRRALEGKP